MFTGTTILYDLAAAAAATMVTLGAGTPVDRYQLDNGLRVVLAPQRNAPVVALQAWVGVGSADEPPRRAGIAHVFEHMLFKGTERRGVGEIAQAVEEAGGDINAWTSFDQTVFHVVLASRYLDTALDVLGDALHRSTFEATELEREREVILEEMRQGDDDPARATAQGLFSTAFVRHPYRRPILGDPESVRGIRRAHLLDFHRKWYVADNIALVLAGDFDARSARRKIARCFGVLPSGRRPRRHCREPRQLEPRARVVEREVSEAQVALGFHVPPILSDDTAALDVAAIVLGQGESSRLGADVRRGAELVTDVHSFVHSLRDPGLFVVAASMAGDRAKRAVEAIAAQIGRLAHEEISSGELAKARQAVTADAIYRRETVEGIARQLGYYETVAGDARFEDHYVDRVHRVTAADVKKVAAKYLDPERATLSAVVPRARRRRKSGSQELLAGLGRGAQRAVRTFALPAAAALTSGDLVREELPNGVRVIIKRDRSVPLVAARAAWTGGLRYETAKVGGVTHLLASTITRGCGDRSSEEVIREVDESASSLSGFSGRNSFGVRAEWLADEWEAGFDLMADCILEPRFEPEEVARERRQILDDLAVREDSPSFVVFRLFAETLYQVHPYRLDPLGSTESVSELSRRNLSDYYRRTYPVSGMTLAVVGDVDPARVLARVKARFGSRPRRKGREPKIPQETFEGRPAAQREVYRYMDREQAHLIIGFPGTTVDDPDRHALEVLTTVLGGQGGRLFVELRDKQALAYRVGAYSLEGVDPGYIAVYMACSPEKLPGAVSAVRRELLRVAEKGVSKRELERAEKYLIGTHAISLQRRSSLASALAFYEAYGLGYDAYRRYPKAIAAVTREDVRRVAAEYFDWDQAVTATVVPREMSPEATRRARGVRKRAPRKRSRGRSRRR